MANYIILHCLCRAYGLCLHKHCKSSGLSSYTGQKYFSKLTLAFFSFLYYPFALNCRRKSLAESFANSIPMALNAIDTITRSFIYIPWFWKHLRQSLIINSDRYAIIFCVWQNPCLYFHYLKSTWPTNIAGKHTTVDIRA